MDIFSYLDYRQYLKDRYKKEKSINPHFSFRYFARMAGLSSPGYFKMVMDGDRNLSPNSINQFAKALKLSKKENAYFESLVLFNQAKSDKERDHYFERLTAAKPHSKIKGLERDQLEYFTHPYYVIIRELVSLPHFREDPIWIAKHLKTSIKPKDVEHAIEVLLHLGLVVRQEDGKLVQSDSSIATQPEIESVEIYNFHRSMLNEAKEALLSVSHQMRDITSLTIPMTKNSIPEIKLKIQNFREELIEYINNGPDDYHEVFQLNVQLFPVTNTKK